MFEKLKDSIKDFSDKVTSAVIEKELSEDDIDDVLWDLELSLLQNNVAQTVVERLKQDLKNELVGSQVKRTQVANTIHDALRQSIKDILQQPDTDFTDLASTDPSLVLFMGFNGSGKTTTLAKVANRLKDDYSVLMAAGDTYRAAAIHQLEEHGDNLDVKVIKHEYGADGAAVIYDAKEHAAKDGYDFILADTAGRSHADRNLMEELAKVCRVNQPDFKVLVVDALAGNDVIEQAKKYEDIGFDAIILTKVDVDKKGGAALSLGYVTGKPVMYIGTGQGYDDLERFDPDAMVDRFIGD